MQKKDASPSHQKPEYAEKPQNEYYHSTSKQHPTKLYSYETTNKPVTYAYKSESQTKPKNEHKPAYDHVSPSEYYFTSTVNEPEKAFYESSSYNSDDDKPAEENAPKPQTVEAPKAAKRQPKEQPQEGQQEHAPQVQNIIHPGVLIKNHKCPIPNIIFFLNYPLFWLRAHT